MADVVQVWLIRTGLPDPLLADLEAVLDDTERRRARALLEPAERTRFVAAHGAARQLIGRALGVPAAGLGWRYGPHGKPELTGPWAADAQVSLSHSGELAALALTGARRVGIDLQRVLAGVDVTGMARRFYPAAEARFVVSGDGPAEQASRFTRLWTRKEACVKVAGGRLIPGLRLPVRDPDEAGGQLIVTGPPDSLPAPCLVSDVPVPGGCYAAVALEGPLPYRVTRHWWPDDRPVT